MRELVSSKEASRLDAAVSGKWAVPPIILMENAAVRLWKALDSSLGSVEYGREGAGKAIVALAGSGNNGGDALALLRQARFAGRRDLIAILAGGNPGESTALQLCSLEAMGIPIISWPDQKSRAESAIRSAGVLVDGIAGTGLHGPLGRAQADLVSFAASTDVPVAAIDLPSGLSDEMEAGRIILPARWSLSVEPRKASLYYPASRELSGDIIAIEGVFPDGETGMSAAIRALLLEEADLPAFAPHFSRAAHKGERGRLAVFAGEPGSSGAARFAARAAQAAGAGLVCLYAQSALHAAFSADASSLGGAVVREESLGTGDLAQNQAILAGPGWGWRAKAEGVEADEGMHLTLLGEILASGAPAVLDAGAIRLLPSLATSGRRAGAALVLTPHPGEFEALTGVSVSRVLAEPPTPLLEAARKFQAVIVLKSQVTWIAAPDGRLAVWDGRDASLACAGSGDVLAGALAGILSARSSAVGMAGISGNDAAFDAARCAVIAHGLSGRRARKRCGWYEAGELIPELGRILEEASR